MENSYRTCVSVTQKLLGCFKVYATGSYQRGLAVGELNNNDTNILGIKLQHFLFWIFMKSQKQSAFNGSVC